MTTSDDIEDIKRVTAHFARRCELMEQKTGGYWAFTQSEAIMHFANSLVDLGVGSP